MQTHPLLEVQSKSKQINEIILGTDNVMRKYNRVM